MDLSWSTSGLARAYLPRGAGTGFLEEIGYLRVSRDRRDNVEQSDVEFLFWRRGGRAIAAPTLVGLVVCNAVVLLVARGKPVA